VNNYRENNTDRGSTTAGIKDREKVIIINHRKSQPKQKRYVGGGKAAMVHTQNAIVRTLHQARRNAKAAAKIETNPPASGTWCLFAPPKIAGVAVDPAAVPVRVVVARVVGDVSVGAVTGGAAGAVVVVGAGAGAAGEELGAGAAIDEAN
jgi:hypothetical protein